MNKVAGSVREVSCRFNLAPHFGLILSSHYPLSLHSCDNEHIFDSGYYDFLDAGRMFQSNFRSCVWDFLLWTCGPWDRSFLDRLMVSCIPPSMLG